jgi:hypothetical protein
MRKHSTLLLLSAAAQLLTATPTFAQEQAVLDQLANRDINVYLPV